MPDYAESVPCGLPCSCSGCPTVTILPPTSSCRSSMANSIGSRAPSFATSRPDTPSSQPRWSTKPIFRFFDKEEPPPITGRAHFLTLMARVMRQILVDHARAVATAKRGGRGKVTWDTNIEIQGGDGTHQMKVLEVHEALEALARENTSFAQVIEMHYFGGLTAAEMALATGKSIHIVQHELRFARAWLRRQMAAE